MRIGVLGIQGAVSEHVEITKKALEELNLCGEVRVVKRLEHLQDLNGLIIPGGESTTISRMLKASGLFEELKRMARDIGIMGTCAGAILLAKEVVEKNVETLGLMDITVSRNAYGRQVDSFEADVEISGFTEKFHAVFIRAPIIKSVYGKAKALATDGRNIIMAKQEKMLALTFHPELSGDTRIHKMFIEMVGAKY